MKFFIGSPYQDNLTLVYDSINYGLPINQINIDENGLISAISVIKGQGVKIDNRVVELIKAYDAEKPISNTNIEKPSILQLEIPLVVKQYFN